MVNRKRTNAASKRTIKRLHSEALEPRCMLAADPIISEFMASNDSTLLDGDGNSSDWIEIQNTGDQSANLTGWTLTDDPAETDKWSFPSGANSQLAAGDFLVVFASGTNTPDPSGNLHTNFKLQTGGDYLGLYRPDGSLVNQFAADGTNYPAQRQDVSYGLDGDLVETQIVDRFSTADYLVPTNGTLGTTWTTNSFNASANGFSVGSAAIGYENTPGNATSYTSEIETTVPSGTTTTYVRVEFNVVSADDVVGLDLEVKYDDGFIAYLNGTQVAVENAPASPSYNSAATSSHSDTLALQYQPYSLDTFIDLLVDGQNTLAFHALNRTGSSDYLLSPALTIQTVGIGSSAPSYMSSPTPGGPNTSGFSGFIDELVFSHQRGFHDTSFNLAISSATAGTSIYYTFDGSEPTPSNGVLYSAPILINQTETIRAAAFLSTFEPTAIATQTYVLLEDVLVQDPRNNPKHGLSYPSIWQGNASGDYEIDSRVVDQWDDNDPTNTDLGIREGLLSIPSISLVLDHDDLWNQSSGIYPNTTSTGSSWRRPGSVEYFDPTTGEQFQYDVGIQMQGAASRDNARLKKHSLRLIFSDDYGPGRLNFPLFDNSDFDDINTVSLKASFTDAFATRTSTNRYSPLDSLYMRDVWMRDSQIAMGHLAADSTYAHLYINGLYWGLYWPSERVDDAYLSSRIGGEKEDWDIVRDFNELFRGNRSAYDQMFSVSRQIDNASAAQADALFQQLQGNNADGTTNPGIAPLLDVDNFIDYMALHLYAGVEDWPSHNWYAARNRVDPGKGFQFFTWDQEIALDQLYRDRTEASNSNTPGELFQNLRNSSEFRLRVADRVQKHLFNDGALTPSAGQARLMQRSDQIESGIIGESARWGDAREGQNVTAYTSRGPLGDGEITPGSQTIPLMTVDHWRDARDYVHDSYLESAGDLLITRLQSDGLFTTVDAPSFRVNGAVQHGGLVETGDFLGISGNGQIYYTADGTDPRALGGAPQGTLYSGLLGLSGTTQIHARSFSGGSWSALSEATFTVTDGGVVISELNYHPYLPVAANELAFDNDDFEFVEVFNSHPSTTANLFGMQLADAISFTFDNSSLAPGERGVVVKNTAAFEARYGTSINILGTFSGGLKNSSEEVDLLDGLGGIVMSVEYGDSDPWSKFADGVGASLELSNAVSTPTAELGKYYRWDHSATIGGTPGGARQSPPTVVINEVLAHTDLPQLDAIELYNPTSAPINIGGWYLSDSKSDLLKFEVPANTVLGIDEYLVFDENDFNDPGSQTPARNFALSAATGDNVYLVIPNATGTAAETFVDDVSFGASFVGQSFGRTPNGDGRLAVASNVTLGSENAAPSVGPLVISEVNYHPSTPSSGALAIDSTLTTGDLEFVEIHNPTANPVTLTNWRLRGEVDFDFADGTALPAMDSVVLLSFDPNEPTNANRLLAFEAHYQTTNVDFVGPYTGKLSNAGGRIALQRPDSPPIDMPNTIPHVLADEVLYDDLVPWPVAADGAGPSLHRAGPTMFGNNASNWRDFTATPGTTDFVPSLPGDYDRNGAVEQADYDLWLANFNSTVAINADGNNNGIVDAADYTVWRDNLVAVNALALSTSAYNDFNSVYAHNESQAEDVNGNGLIEPLDALLVLNALNARDARTTANTVSNNDFLDVSNDGELSPIDALRVINRLNPPITQVGTNTRLGDWYFDKDDDKDEEDEVRAAKSDLIWSEYNPV